MQCPSCGQELADQAHCQNCDWQGKASEKETSSPEAPVIEEPAEELNTTPAQDSPLQSADSFDQKTESEPPANGEEGKAAQPSQPASPAPDIKITVSGSTVDAKGNINIIGVAQGLLNQTEQSKIEEEKSLYSLTERRPQRPSELHHSVRAELGQLVSCLRTTRLMFVTCAYKKFAKDAGSAAVEGLTIADPEHDRVLRHDEALRKNVEFNVGKLLEQKLEEEGDTAILVDAHAGAAEEFSDSILRDPAWLDITKDALESKHLFLVVIISSRYAAKTLRNVKRNSQFVYWEIPFLRPFLEQNYPSQHEQLQALIIQQRAEGLWEKDETDFCQQIISYHDREQLQKVVEGGGPKDPDLLADSLLTGSSQVEKVVLYAAAFFQEITPLEFCRVVESLLAKRTIKISLPTNGARGDAALVPAQAEIPLSQIWEEEKDDIFTRLLRETSSDKESVKVVGLSDPALREPLRRFFDKRHRFYLIDQFKALQERGIFFYPSIRLAENTTQIAVEMACLYSDEFNEGWIVSLIRRLRQHFESDSSSAPDGEDAMFQFLRSSQPGALRLALARVSDIFRRMLELAQLKGMVHSSFEHLIKGGYQEDTLLLLKLLQFTPEFDALYWFKQLLHRADPRTRHLTYIYLCSYLKGMGSGVYEGLKKIETWLPHAERDPGSYSQFDNYVLRLLIQYSVETVARFNAKHYGDWPSRYPLFAIKDYETARERTSLLARWLLHPGIDATLVGLRMGGTQMTLIGALLAEWTFILLGPSEPSPVDTQAPPGRAGATIGTERVADNGFSSAKLYDLLIQQFASRTDSNQRLELLKYWNRLNYDLLIFLGALSYASELRKELGWKRNLVSRLIKQFKNAATAGKTPQRPAQITSLSDSTSA
jgi:hypothetical protein